VFEDQSVMLVQIMPNLIPQICWYAFFVSVFMDAVALFIFLGLSLHSISISAVAIQYCCLKFLIF
jgi:hypothetical protein